MTASSRVLLRPLDVVEYDLDELAAYITDDAAWRARAPGVFGGPLRDRFGKMAPVPAAMRLDIQTDRNGPVPEFAPHLGPCWIFTGALTKGYGYIRVGKRKVQGYRFNYERWVGPIPEGMLLDHLCRVRACVHPLHVEPTTYSKNATRSPIHDSQVKAARDKCPAGHEFDEANTYRPPGTNQRQCRACMAENKRRRTGAEPRRLASDTHCGRGHEWPEPRGRKCPICNREDGRAFRERKRATQAAGAS